MANPLGSTPGIIVGVGVGQATGAALEPAIELPRQKAWQDNPNRLLDPGTLARLVAQGGVTLGAAQADARRHGFDADQVDALVYLAQTVPPVAEALTLWRRGLISDALWSHVLVKNGIDARYHPPLGELKVSERLDPSVVATAVQRGILPNEGILPVPPPTAQGVVPPMPIVDLSPHQEAREQGVDADRIAAMTRIVGLPPAPVELLDLVNRGIIEDVDYFRGIAEGNTRNEWAPFLLQLRHRLVTADTVATLWLKGWIDEPEARRLAARVGYGPEEISRLYLAAGRPAAPGQMATAVARGVDGPAGRPMDREQFQTGIRESNIRPEWGAMLWGIRFAYPPLFQINRLRTAGAITTDEAVTWAEKDRYAPEVVAALRTYWDSLGGGVAGKEETKTEVLDEYEGRYITEAEATDALTALGYAADAVARLLSLADARRAKRARDQVVNRAHLRYVGWRIDEAEARTALADAGISTEAVNLMVPEWTTEREINTTLLTPAQIKKAFRSTLKTRAEALSELEERGMSPADAATLLDE